MDLKQTWLKILANLQQTLSDTNFRGWLPKAELTEVTDTKIVISVPNTFFADNLRIKFLPEIEAAASEVLGRKLSAEFKIDSTKTVRQDKKKEESIFDFVPEAAKTPVLNPKYTLENFVVGPSNNVAFAAAQAVIQNPGVSYNPLFLYGGTGVGKTHLMLAVGNSLLNKNPDLKVIYCTSEMFMNDYIESIKNNRSTNLRSKYRSLDVLLIDDIQFFSGREGTQEEFFHTFNELQSKNSQVILTSDRAPQDIAKLEDRLKSRFVGGLMLDIQPPDFDTRMAILEAKCAQNGENIPESVLRLLASSLDTNIRELEGKLIQILQTLKAQNLEITIENVQPLVKESTNKAVQIDQKRVLSTICGYFDLNTKDLTGPKRQKELVLPRHIAMYLLCEELNMTVERVGQILGGRDHTTVMHGRDRVKKLLNTDREVQKIFIEVKNKLTR
jgi:chromosomal replication initiator protein